MMSLITIGKRFRMTKKTKVFLWLYYIFNRLAQWFITHCDYEDKNGGDVSV